MSPAELQAVRKFHAKFHNEATCTSECEIKRLLTLNERYVLGAARQESLEACACWVRAYSIAIEQGDLALALFNLERAEESARIADEQLIKINSIPI